MKLIATLLLFITLAVSFSNYADAATVSDPPSSISATAVSPTQINIFWSAPAYNGDSAVNGYRIEYKIGSGSYNVLVANTGGGTMSYSHTGLTQDLTYTYRVFAINSVGTSGASPEASATPTSSSTGSNPGAPTGLSAVPVSPTRVDLFWSAPTNNGGHPVTGYKVEYRVGSGSYTTLIANTGTSSTTYSHMGLTTNQVYVYRVYAITSFGTSEQPSNEDHATPTSSSAPSAPAQVSGLSATAVSPTEISLSWTQPSDFGSSPITGYKIEVKSGSGSYSTLVSNTGSTSTLYRHTGLTTGTAYTYKVSAINSVGTGAASGEQSATPTSSSTSGTPGAPTGLTASASSGTQINLSWSAPANNGGYPVTGYKIEYKIGSGSYSTLVTNTGTSSTTYSHTGLTSGQSYSYRVSAVNSVGVGAASNEASSTLESSSSASPPSAPSSLSAASASKTQINLSWSAPANNGGSQVTGYKIEVKKGSGSYETLVANSQSTLTSFSHTGLATGSTYYYRVYALNSAGTGAPSEASATAQDTVAPALSATAVSPTSITLSWVPPSQTYNQAIKGYKIEEKISVDDHVTIVDNTGTTATSYTITGLTTGSSHTYVVSAYFTLGASPLSNEATATPTSTSAPPSSQPTASSPSAPTGLSATPFSPTQVNLSWSAPTSSGGSPITGYKIDVKKGAEQFQTLVSSTQNTTLKYSHTGLITDTPYSYRVYAINAVGISQASNEATATPTVSATPPPSQSTPPGAPSLSATLISPTQVNLSWSAPGDSAVTHYKIEYKIGSGSYLTLTSREDDTTFSHTGLLQNTYTYRVYAANSAGFGPASNVVSISTVDDTGQDSEDPGTDGGAQPDVPKPADFVDPSVDPMYYVNRYNNEPAYKEWFDTYYSGMTIYEAVGLTDPSEEPTPIDSPPEDEPKLAAFVDPERDPMHYVNRYNNEPAYKEWFERNYSGMTIYEAVGLPNPGASQGADSCGPGTHLEDGLCVLDEEDKSAGCLIATAVFGSELSPQVQMLREVRDNVLYDTRSGAAFMTGFNKFYYSFSPAVADLERQSPVFKEAVKMSITPMLSTLSILNYVDIDSEQQMLGYGIALILLNAGMYFGIPAAAMVILRNKVRRN